MPKIHLGCRTDSIHQVDIDIGGPFATRRAQADPPTWWSPPGQKKLSNVPLFQPARGIRIEAIQNLPDLRFLFLPLLPTPAPKREYNAVSLQWPMKFGNIVRVETSRYLTKITTLRRKAIAKVLAAKHTASL